MKFERRLSAPGDPFADVPFAPRDSVIQDHRTGGTVFALRGVPFPESWGQSAVDILASKYLRRAGVPARTVRVAEPAVPEWLWRSEPDGDALAALPEAERFGGERDARQAFLRLSGCWTYWGWKQGLFDSEDDARVFHDEMCAMLSRQIGSANSPQWFNTGLHWAYGITGPPQGHWYVDHATGEMCRGANAYEHPTPHACFIQSVDDDLCNEGGIMDLWNREALVFKFGAGSGSNFGKIRGEGELLSGGGTSSGLMSFLRIGDRGAGAIKSGGTTRRAAKMVVVPADHPDIEAFVSWKPAEEQKVAMLAAGAAALERHYNAIMRAAHDDTMPAEGRTSPALNKALRRAMADAIAAGIPSGAVQNALDFAKQGFRSISVPRLDANWEGEAYATVSGQNSNNSVRVPNSFFDALAAGGGWDLIGRTDGRVLRTIPAADLWDRIAMAAWQSADPGVQYDTTINEWHTCPAEGRINASNPCSEFLFVDDSACNLASLNLGRFYGAEDGSFDAEGFAHAVRLWTVALEISVTMAQFPARAVARVSYDTRTLGLGYANLGSLLMRMGLPYDSQQGFAVCADITSIMCAVAYRTSAEMAETVGPFPLYERNRESMLRVIRNHRRAAYGAPAAEYEGLSIVPSVFDGDLFGHDLREFGRRAWDEALALGERVGFRNAQVTVIAPTGTIAFVMGCDSTGIEPDYALVKFKTLAGGGSMKIVNRSVRAALRRLGYSDSQIRDVEAYIGGLTSLESVPHINRASLKSRGMTDEGVAAIEESLPRMFVLEAAFSPMVLGDAYCADVLGVSPESLADPGYSILRDRLGFTDAEIVAASDVACGFATIEGAPHIRPEHMAVFDCATPAAKGERFIRPLAHVDMMAAAQPWVSGAISKTVNMPRASTVADIREVYEYAFKRGIKAVAVYRDGSKLSQPLESWIAPLIAVDEETIAKEEARPFSPPAAIARQIVYRYLAKKRSMPSRRRGYHQKVSIAGHDIIVSTGEYDDGTLGEIFIHTSKDGSTLRAMMNNFAIAVSVGLQHGVPLDEYADKFMFSDFEPKGPVVGDDVIKNCGSLVDYIFRSLAVTYLQRWDLAHVKPEDLRPADVRPPEFTDEAAGDTQIVPTAVAEADAARRVPSAHVSHVPDLSAPRPSANGHAGVVAVLERHASPAGSGARSSISGSVCGRCGSADMIRTGTCITCNRCGENSGCS